MIGALNFCDDTTERNKDTDRSADTLLLKSTCSKLQLKIFLEQKKPSPNTMRSFLVMLALLFSGEALHLREDERALGDNGDKDDDTKYADDGGGDDDDECNKDSDCAFGLVCDDGSCVECSENYPNHCPWGLVCDFANDACVECTEQFPACPQSLVCNFYDR